MSFIDKMLNQTAVYWGNPTKDGYGSHTYDDPIEIDCRWIDTTEAIIDNKGEQILSRAKVIVDQDVDEMGMLYLGTLDDLDSDEEEDPQSIDGAYEIRKFDKVPSIKADKFYRRAWL